ncbi:NrfD/PsrC family molybdoenzyme membrane anchor subunit [Desulforamulus hydrothermalis]|uniref:Hydrogenase 2 cytochrome b type component n=1 Tax=Desulforamulus hydrothermalis Lam5 = DSM 18033 TaxID=1121428 RepID=K8EHV0_9FIRM|nr:Ni/Fe-hydrogenase cytochrome b subunit [Desulforamulus hydrothermalis]CCO08211.1 hydrogenase 2 cytochrome b type component [Desulforamulus hydrothermalis Lam5 = DSM 18033]SHH22349.1 Ni/Fe-hydrogenase 2 integral membrane subunit HybB [Desulforamulus hydrothermalis Lam5 = DSM 18033]
MASHAQAQKWSFRITPIRVLLLLLSAVATAIIIFRLVTGLGIVTNLSDEWPWGLWIGFDVLCGVALAGGGYGTALIVHVLHRDYFHPIARSAMLTSLLGYLLVMAGLFLDIGQWFNFWRPFVSWGHSSVLFEVFWCVSCYTTVQILEFGEIATERIGKRFHNIFKAALPVLMIVGIIFPTLHQSSLGALYLLMVDKLYPLWWSPIIFLFFLMSSFFVGPAMICVETTLAGKAYNHWIPIPVLRKLIRVSGYAMIIYLVLKIFDLMNRGVFNLVFSGTFEANMFLIEMIFGIIIPIFICFSNFSSSRSGLFIFGLLVSLGVVLNRMNVVITGMIRSTGVSYVPSLAEFTVSAGLVAMGVLAYCFIVENFRILEDDEHHSHAA